ncbi:MAG TPA: filamentous hemagglutinin N-terminal domain-containing protein, partial [Phycisphaerales bacterium]|nr:filamentous hemagglutinin N-terminal domain-containing protein [Phycisphaerales bacterium]
MGTNSVNIEQLTNQAIVNWNSFSIGAQEAVRFLQPNQMAVILNRVTGGDPSQILGQLQANGNVFVVNPAGITVGAGARVDVGGLVLSTLGITDENFLSGNYTFEQDPNQALASIVNQGTIKISDGGYAILTAPLISNEGLIVANLGKVVLAGGEKTTLNFDGRNLINYELAGITGDAGTVVMPRESVSAVLTDMLGIRDRAKGLIQREDGSFALEGASGTVYQAGTIRADGAEGQEAGVIAIDSARLTVLGEDSVTAADGVGADSSGGVVYALSNRGRNGDTGGLIVGQEGSLLSSVGGETGDGGFIEFSGEKFDFASSVQTASFLLDPRDIFIIDGAGNTIDGNNDQTIGDAVLEAITAQVITLQADRDIIFNINGQAGGGDNDLNLFTNNNNSNKPITSNVESNNHLVLIAGGDVNFGDDLVITQAIDILAGLDAVAQGRSGNVTGGVIRANDIDIGIDARGGENPAFDGAPAGSGLARTSTSSSNYRNNIVAVGGNLSNRSIRR